MITGSNDSEEKNKFNILDIFEYHDVEAESSSSGSSSRAIASGDGSSDTTASYSSDFDEEAQYKSLNKSLLDKQV